MKVRDRTIRGRQCGYLDMRLFHLPWRVLSAPLEGGMENEPTTEPYPIVFYIRDESTGMYSACLGFSVVD